MDINSIILTLIYLYVFFCWKNTLESYSKPLLMGAMTAWFYTSNWFLEFANEGGGQLAVLVLALLFLATAPLYLVSNVMFAIAEEGQSKDYLPSERRFSDPTPNREVVFMKIIGYILIPIAWFIAYYLTSLINNG